MKGLGVTTWLGGPAATTIGGIRVNPVGEIIATMNNLIHLMGATGDVLRISGVLESTGQVSRQLVCVYPRIGVNDVQHSIK